MTVGGYDRFRRCPAPEETENLRSEVERLRALRCEIESAEARLTVLKADEADLSSKAIPAEMRRLQIESLPLPDGTTVTVSKSFAVSPRKENRQAVMAWLATVGGSPLLSRTLSVEIPKGEDPSPVEQAILLKGFAPTVTESIHPSTLRSFVSDMIEKGEAVPEDLLGVFQLHKTHITTPVFDGE